MSKNKPEAKLPSKLYTTEAGASAQKTKRELEVEDPENAHEIINQLFEEGVGEDDKEENEAEEAL